MRTPVVHEQEKRWQLIFWTPENKRKQKSIGAGQEGFKTAKLLKEAILEGRISADDMLSGKSWEELLQHSNPDTGGENASDTGVSGNPAPTTTQPLPMNSGWIAPPKPLPKVTFKELVELYINDLRARGKSPGHMKDISQVAIKHYYPFFGEDKDITEITYLNHILPFINHLRSFISEQTHKKLSECTCNRLCGYLRSIFRFGFFSELLEKNPMQRWRHPKEPPRRFTVDLNDITKVMSVSAPHVKNVIECSFNLGTRISELLALKWENVNFEQATVRIYATKTRTYREVPVKPDFLEKLRKMKDDAKSEYVIEFRGKRVRSIRMAFVRAVKRSGIGKDFRIHDLRHIYATYMLNNGADLAAVSRMLGHSTVVLTANTYLQYQKGAKEQAIALLPDLPL